MIVKCEECGETIAELIADTNRKEINQKRKAICEYCFGDRRGESPQ